MSKPGRNIQARVRLLGLLGIATAIVLALLRLAHSTSSSRLPPTAHTPRGQTPLATTSQPFASQPVADTANVMAQQAGDRVTEELSRSAPDAIVAMIINPDNSLTVQVGTPITTALEHLASSAAAPVKVTLERVKNNNETLSNVVRKISADSGYWTSQGIEIASYGPDANSNTVLVSLVNYTPAAAKALTARYGAELVTVDSHDGPRPTR